MAREGVVRCDGNTLVEHEDPSQYTGLLPRDNDGSLSDDEMTTVTQQIHSTDDPGEDANCCHGNHHRIVDDIVLSTFIVKQSLRTAILLEDQRHQLLLQHETEKKELEMSLLSQCQTALYDMERKIAQNGDELKRVCENKYQNKVREMETNLQERNAKYLKQLGSQFDVHVKEREDELRRELQQLHLTHIDILVQQYDRERNELVLKMAENFNKEREAEEERHREECDALRRMYEQEKVHKINVQSSDVQREIATVLVDEATRHAHQLNNERHHYEHMMEELKEKYELSLSEMETKHKKAMAAVKEQHDTEMSQLQGHYDSKMAAMKEQYDRHQQEVELAVQNELMQINAKLELLEREKEAELIEKVNIHEQRVIQKEEKYKELLSVKEKELLSLEQQYSVTQEEHCNQVLQLRSKIEYLEQNNLQLSQHCASLQRDKEQLMEEIHAQSDAMAQLKEDSDQQHKTDTVTLDIINQQLHDERLSHQRSINSMHGCIVKLISAIQAVLPFKNDHAYSDTTTSSTHGDNWAPPIAMTTPITSSLKQPTDTIFDSGLASQQTSGGRGIAGGVVSFDDGSVIRALKLSADNVREDADLSIYPLNDISLDSSVASSEELLHQLHTVVTLLLKTFDTTCNQATHYHQQLGILQNELISHQKEHLKVVEQLSKENEDIKRQLLDKDKELKDKVDNGDTNELVEETEKLLVQYQTLEQQLAMAQESIKSLQNDLKLKNETAIEQTTKVVSMEREIIAHESAYKDLLQRKESIELELKQQIENNKLENKKLKQKLQLTEEKLVHLGDLPQEMAEKERLVEEAREQVSQLQQQLLQTQHDLAMADPHHVATLTQQVHHQQLQNKEMSSELSRAKETVLCLEASASELRAKVDNLQESVCVKDASIQSMLSEKTKMEEQCKTLQEQSDTLKQQVDVLLREMAVSGKKVSELCQQLEERQHQLESEERNSKDLREQVNILSTESNQHLQVYEQSVLHVQALQDELAQVNKKLHQHIKTVETLTLENGRLEGEVVRSNGELKEKQEYFELQTRSLENSLQKAEKDLQIALKELTELKKQRVDVDDKRVDNLKREIASLRSQLVSQSSDNSNELEQLQQQHKLELLQLADKLKVDHAAEVAMLKLKFNEEKQKTAKKDDQFLQEIAELAPVLEREATEVKDLCVGESQIKKLRKLVKDKERQLVEAVSQHKAVLSQVDSLEQVNRQLQQDVSETQSAILTLEDTILKANATITKLTTELKASTEREDTLKQQMEALELNMQRKINACERANEELLLAEREIVAQLKQSLAQEQSLRQKVQNDLLLEQDKVSNVESLLNSVNSGVKKYEEDNAILQANLDLAQQQLVEANLRAKQSNIALERNIQDVSKLCQHHRDHDNLHSTIDALQHQLEQQRIRLVGQEELLARNKDTLTRLNKENIKHKQMRDIANTKLKHCSGRCKGLVFQKKYLQSEIDAFYHTEQAAMMLMKDMGAPVDAIRRNKVTSSRLKFKTVAVAVRAAVRFSLLCRKQLRRRKKQERY